MQNYYNKNPILANDKTENLLKEMNGLKDVMVENLSKLLERDGKIEIIASKAEQLSTTSSTYRKNANKARIKMRNRRIFLIAMAVVIAGVSSSNNLIVYSWLHTLLLLWLVVSRWKIAEAENFIKNIHFSI